MKIEEQFWAYLGKALLVLILIGFTVGGTYWRLSSLNTQRYEIAIRTRDLIVQYQKDNRTGDTTLAKYSLAAYNGYIDSLRKEAE